MQMNTQDYQRRRRGKSHHLTNPGTGVTKKPKTTAMPNLSKNEDSQDQPIVNTIPKWNRTIISNLRMAALNNPWSGKMYGLDHINYQCQKEAMDAGINGVFRAFLSVRGNNIKSIVRNSKDPIVNIYNKTMFATWSDVLRINKNMLQYGNQLLAAGSTNTNSGLYSFNGKNVIIDENWDINLIWHGAHLTGRSSHRNCRNWTSDSESDVGIAADFLFKFVLHQQDEKCNAKLIVLCIEIPPYFVQKYVSPQETQVENMSATGDGRSRTKISARNITFHEHKQLLKDYYLN
ncbi:unnamed protein product [Orchesella dallaii]|uniref:Collagenase NC10/endostatin domain-containing protein n=1 Tax=Orchesella dallaii TaxID=48710 RepID=A0ABP1RN70_9HEXA